MAVCAIEGCDSPQRKREWCDRHYQAWRRHGDPLGSTYEWAARAEACVACGKPEIAPQMRKFCSVACRQSEYRGRLGQLSAPLMNCAGCSEPLSVGRRDGRTQHKSSRRLCSKCRKPRRSYRLAVDILAHYQGTDCGICGESVDMSIRFPDKRCASIDHIVPIAVGGTDEVSNLRLAHFDCNAKREVLFVAIREGALE